MRSTSASGDSSVGHLGARRDTPRAKAAVPPQPRPGLYYQRYHGQRDSLQTRKTQAGNKKNEQIWMHLSIGGSMVIFENDQTGKPKLRTLWKLYTGHYDTYGTLGYGPRHEFYLFSENIFLHQRTRWCDPLGWVIGSSIPYHVDSK